MKTDNEITKKYYDFLKGEINRGTIRNKTVYINCRSKAHDYYSYHIGGIR